MRLVVAGFSSLLIGAFCTDSLLRSQEKPDYEKIALKTKWPSLAGAPNLGGCVARELDNYDVEIMRKKGMKWELTIRVFDKGKELISIKGHSNTVFIESNGILYYADYAPCASGCVIIAYDLKKQAQLWRSELKGIGKLAHSLYQNTVRMERFDGTVFAIYGEESFGSYFELVEYATGKTVGHKIFSEKK